MIRLLVAGGVAVWVGATLVLAEFRWFARVPLSERLRPYAPGGLGRSPTLLLASSSFRDVIRPLARSVGSTVARIVGVTEELAVRLERVHSPLDVTAFRMRQLGGLVAGFAGGILVAAAARPPFAGGAVLVVGGPLLAFLLLEQQLARASAAWQRRVFLELPVVGEQLAMLLSAGYSLGSALNRIAQRSSGAVARDLERVCNRIRHGLNEIDAIREWAEIARVPALDRLVPVLAMNREASDLGRLISDEARSIRRDVHRELVEMMERRGQEVWIPVTVATLIPGVIFLAIPFIEALRLFAGS
jgi:Flp pilus assembly protein TadB